LKAKWDSIINLEGVVSLKKILKGFTLVEVIVAMAVFTIMALLVCTLYAFLGNMTTASSKINREVDTQVSTYENETPLDASIDKITQQNIIFGSGASAITVEVDVNVIEGNNPDQDVYLEYFGKH